MRTELERTHATHHHLDHHHPCSRRAHDCLLAQHQRRRRQTRRRGPAPILQDRRPGISIYKSQRLDRETARAEPEHHADQRPSGDS
ncbi:MAG: hypothetical protein JWR78_3290 [Mycobacterium sp.]|nr:hypothetical protein [Mycobacterium sp.]